MSCERLADPNIELYPLEYPLKGQGGGEGTPLKEKIGSPVKRKKHADTMVWLSLQTVLPDSRTLLL